MAPRSDLAEHTTGLRWVLERVAAAQQRSEAALGLMLGQAWTTEDLAFYASAAGARTPEALQHHTRHRAPRRSASIDRLCPLS
jgi:hypothetical protein